MAVIQAFLNEEFADPGEYLLLPVSSAAGAIVEQLRDGSLGAEDIQSLVDQLVEDPGLPAAIANTGEASSISAVLTRSTQSSGLDRLRKVIEDPNSTEPDIQKVLQKEWWVFGGKYVSAALRRSFTVLDQFDIALIQADNSLHLVEIKQANIPKLVVKDHNHWIMGDDVHKAVSQSINYLRSLDEQRAQILADFGIDCRRASATVVLGHSRFVRTGATTEQMSDAMRTYNAHLSRIEVVTYEELLGSAQRFLEIGREQANRELLTDGHDGYASPTSSPWDFDDARAGEPGDPWEDVEPPF
jgi:hypothetical protein